MEYFIGCFGRGSYCWVAVRGEQNHWRHLEDGYMDAQVATILLEAVLVLYYTNYNDLHSDNDFRWQETVKLWKTSG